jgi:glycosyltransferase involved in cell wall biosynthesis
MAELIEFQNITSEPTPWIEISDPAVLDKIPPVSVMMITYNHAPYISRAIEGVLQQETNFPFELVIGEDCSTDDTREIVFEYQKKYPNIIRIITSEKNVGMQKNAYRTGKACRGRYLAFCEGDDYWHVPYKLKKQVDYLESNPECGLVYSSYDVYHCSNNKIINDFIKYRKWEIIENPKLTDYFIVLKPIGGRRVGILTCTVMIREKLYKQIIESDPYLYISDHFISGDIQIWAEVINISSIHFIPDSMSTYRLTEESATRSKDIKKVLRLHESAAELMVYMCKKYNFPSEIVCKYEKNRQNILLKLSCYTRNAGLAENLKKIKDRWSYLEWLRYYGAKNVLFYNIYLVAWKFKNMFTKENEEWQ